MAAAKDDAARHDSSASAPAVAPNLAAAREDAGPAPQPAAAPMPSAPQRPRKGVLGRLVFLVVVLAGLGYGAQKARDWYEVGRFIVSTDDAYIKAETAIIAAKVSGYIAEVAVRDNEAVAAGDILVRIEDGDYRIAEAAAREKIATQDATIARIAEQSRALGAQVEQARAQIGSAEAELRRAEAAFSRSESLARSHYSTQAALDTALADRDRAIASLASNKAALAAAEANRSVMDAQSFEAGRLRAELVTMLAKAQRDRAFTEIRAPFAGVVGNRAAQPGAFVQPGTRLLALIPLESAYVEANFKETQLSALKPGQTVIIAVDAHADRKIEGRLASIAPASGSQFSLLPPDNATGNFTKIVQRVPVRIELPPDVVREGWLRPGLSVVAGVRTGGLARTGETTGAEAQAAPVAPRRAASMEDPAGSPPAAR